MEQESTSDLMKILKSTEKSGFEKYEKDHLPEEPADFVAYMDAFINEKKLKRQDISQSADISRDYGYQLLSGRSRAKNRDTLLRLFFAMGLTLKEVQRALELYPQPPLYPKNRRDALLIIAFNKGNFTVDQVNEWLAAHGEPELARGKNA